jgi:hypothetical protein
MRAEGGAVRYVVEMPVEGGGVLRVQGTEDEIPPGLVPAANPLNPETMVVKTNETVQAALDDMMPAITATTNRLRKFAADEVTVEFGLATAWPPPPPTAPPASGTPAPVTSWRP